MLVFHNYNNLSKKMKQNIKYFILLSLNAVVLFLSSCDDKVATYSYDENLIGMIIADNPNLSLLNTSVNRTELFDTLLQTGPYTVFAPSDAAFSASGYNSSNINSIGKTALTKIIRYHIFEGTDPIGSLPLGFNQEIRTESGFKFFVTRYDNGTDTIQTINGVPTYKQVYSATNGNIRIISKVLQPYTFETLTEVIANETDLTLFRQALIKTSFNSILAEAGSGYTIFAPNNNAMITYGYSTLQTINAKNVNELEAFVRRCIVDKRRFVYDYILLDDGSETGTEELLSGETVAVNLIPDSSNPGSYTGITLAGGYKSTVALTRQDLLTGNGVLHIINRVLPE